MSETYELIDKLRCRWLGEGIAINRGVSSKCIEDFQRKHSVVLPRDLNDYFLYVNGMEPGEMDNNQIRYWPLSEFKPFLEEMPTFDRLQYAGYFIFADYSIWAHAYAIKLTNKDSDVNYVSLVGGDKPLPLANSFSEFIFLYLNHIESFF